MTGVVISGELLFFAQTHGQLVHFMHSDFLILAGY